MFHASQIVILTNFVVASNVSINRIDYKKYHYLLLAQGMVDH